MRKELELIELIENYLTNGLSISDKAAFEARMQNSTKLQNEVALQKNLMESMELIAVRGNIEQAYRKYRLGKNGWKFGAGGAGLIVLAIATMFFLSPNTELTSALLDSDHGPAVHEAKDIPMDSLSSSNTQIFIIDPSKENVLASENGVLFGIPENAFYQDEELVQDSIELELTEAISAQDIMRAGLSTMSGKDLLETGGMFYIKATKEGSPVDQDAEKPIQMLVPTNEPDPNMMQWDGEAREDGVIDWVDPTPLQKFLLPVNIHDLDFYPPRYEDKLAELGLNVTDKNFKDSLFYSFIYRPVEVEGVEAVEEPVYIIDVQRDMDPLTEAYLTTVTDSLPLADKIRCGIDPARIKAIWNDDFQNTLIATREFEERLKSIYATCENEVLDLYVDNLDKRISAIDSLAVSRGYSEFGRFAARGDGAVAGSNDILPKLKEAYYEKQRAFSKAVQDAQTVYWQEQSAANDVARTKRTNHQRIDSQRAWGILNEETQKNLEYLTSELGVQNPFSNWNASPVIASTNANFIPPPPPPPTRIWQDPRSQNWAARSAYKANIVINRWKNIDVMIGMNSWATREGRDLNVRNAQTGKRAQLKYADLSATVEDLGSYDRVFVYLLPDQLNSFQRMQKRSNDFFARLNQRFEYDLMVIGYKGDDIYFWESAQVQEHNALTASLEPISDEALNDRLFELDKSRTRADLFSDLAYYEFQQVDRARQQEVAKRGMIRSLVEPVVLPCTKDREEPDYWLAAQVESDTNANIGTGGFFTIVENMPTISGCEGVSEQEKRACSEAAITEYLALNIRIPRDMTRSTTAYVNFVVGTDGSVQNVQILSDVPESLQEEIIRVFSNLPGFTPGRQRGQAVPVQYTIPVNVQLR